MQNKLPFMRRVSKRFPLLTILISGVLLLTSFAIIFSSQFNADVLRRIPNHGQKTSLYFNLIEKTGTTDKAYIVFAADHIMDHTQMIGKIADEIRASRMIKTVSWKESDEIKAFLNNVYARKAPLFLSEAEIQVFLNKLTPEGMRRELDKTKQRLTISGREKGLAMKDLLNFQEVFRSHMKLSDGFADSATGYFLTPDKKKLIMLLTPAGSSRDIAFSKEFISSMEAILTKYRGTGLTAELAGSHVIALHEAAAMKREILVIILVSLITVIFIFFVFFRSLKGLLYVMTPVVFSIITTLGMAILLTGALPEGAGASAGLIAGLGIDLGILLYLQYLIGLNTYTDPIERMDSSIGATYRSITTGAVTTALTFLPMALSSFMDLRELGLLTGIGILVCWLFLFTLASLSIKPSSGRFIEIPMLGDLAVFSCRRPFLMITSTLCLSLMAVLFIPRIPFVENITGFGTDSNGPRMLIDSLRETRLSERSVFITDVSMEMESALIKSVEIKDALAKDFEHITAAGDILPPEIRQKKNLARLAALDPQRIISNFRKIAAAKGFDGPELLLFTEGLNRMLQNREIITLRDIEPVREELERLLIHEDDQWRIIVFGTLRNSAPLSALDGFTHTGPVVIRQELASIMKKDATITGIIVLVLVTIVLYLDFRRFYQVMLCQAPAVISILCTLGVMGISGISLNFMNAIVFLLIYGIGTDYAVHLLHRYKADRDMKNTFLQTGKAMLVAGLATIAGFGPVGFSSHKGMASMGQVAAIGVALCIILSLTLVPALLRLHERQDRQ